MTERQVATEAERYWKTYLPSQYETIEDEPRSEFFRRLAAQVTEQVDAAMEKYKQPSTSSSIELTRAYQGAREAAQEIALTDLVFLPPEPGMEDRRMEGGTRLGWDEEDAPAV